MPVVLEALAGYLLFDILSDSHRVGLLEDLLAEPTDLVHAALPRVVLAQPFSLPQQRRNHLHVELRVVIDLGVLEGVDAKDTLDADPVVEKQGSEQFLRAGQKLVRLFIDPIFLRQLPLLLHLFFYIITNISPVPHKHHSFLPSPPFRPHSRFPLPFSSPAGMLTPNNSSTFVRHSTWLDPLVDSTTW